MRLQVRLSSPYLLGSPGHARPGDVLLSGLGHQLLLLAADLFGQAADLLHLLVLALLVRVVLARSLLQVLLPLQLVQFLCQEKPSGVKSLARLVPDVCWDRGAEAAPTFMMSGSM